ncbi:MAG: hypothetical protein KatS3mg089_0702 [Patescibacteria group bacterium]|nr:MAG: hypothetical protein KatS3mg089_0702 [Patescibacteria group bacterium]
MAKGSGYFKGEKKKQKKEKEKHASNLSLGSPLSYSLPEVISKKKKTE